jgi:hypothetical protein
MIMKKLVLLVCFGLLSVGIIYAQSFPVEKFKKVKKDEVPAVVQNSLKNDFSISPNAGNWVLHYTEDVNGTQKPTLKVMSFIFRQKNDGKKIEISFSPNGNLEHTKGVEKSSLRHSES